MKVIGFIPAKKYSSRVPNKNLLKINGISGLERAINYLKRYTTDIFVSTDCPFIGILAGVCNANYYERDELLAKDDSKESDVVADFVLNSQHILTNEDIIIITHANEIVNIDVTEAIDKLKNNIIDSFMTVVNLGKYHPDWSLGLKEGFLNISDLDNKPSRMQDLPLKYQIAGNVYGFRVGNLYNNMFDRKGNPHWILRGRTLPIVISEKDFVHIDTYEDVEYAKKYFTLQNLA